MDDQQLLVDRCVSEEAEQSLLGALFLQAQWYFQVVDTISAGSFWFERHRRIWEAIGEIVQEERAVDVMTVGDKLADRGKLEACGGPSYLTRLSNIVPSGSAAADYADIVARLEKLRQLWNLGERLKGWSLEHEADPDDIAAHVVQEVRSETVSARTRRTTEQIDEDFGATLEGEDDEGTCWDTGINGLDFLLGGGLVAGRNVFLAALPKMGKSSAAVAIAGHMAEKHDFAVDLYGVEQSHEELEARFVSWAENCDVDQALGVIRQGGRWSEVDEALREKIDRGRQKFRSWDLEIDVRGEHDVAEIALAAQARVASLPEERAGRYLLIVDYLQAQTAGNRRGDRWGDIVDVSTTIRDVAKSLNVPVLSLLQFGGKAEERFHQQNKRPHFTDAWGSSQFQKDANHGIVLHRKYFDEGGRAEHFCQFYQDYSRHGGNGRVADLYADLAHCRFAGWTGLPPEADQQEEAGESKTWATSF